MVQSLSRTNPFPGLRPFELDEEHLFFGREGQADELLTRLHRTRFLAVVGTSGSGKSSLVRAGLLPSLYSGLMQRASSSWRVAILRPGSAPMANLAAALNAPEVFGADPASDDAVIHTALTESTLRRGALGLVEVTQQARMAAHENLLVVVDQFEELFRFKIQAQNRHLEAEDEAAAFVKLLLGAVNQREIPIFVVLTMRSDFLGDCAQFRDLPETLNDSQYLIPRLTREQLRSAIAGPVAVGGATITPRLVNRLLNDTGDNPDQLPILQHALMRTWDYWEDQGQPQRAIDIEHYEAIGGMAEALSRHADQIYTGLPGDKSRQIAEALFRRLTDRGPDNREIRRPTTLGEIGAVANANEAEVVAVVDEFRGARRSFLMPPLGAPLHRDTVIDISHESLMRNWQRLRSWVDEEVQSAHIYRRLAETAELYSRNEAGYWRDPELTNGLTWLEEQQPNQVWAERYAPNFDEAVLFLEASATSRDQEKAEKEKAQQAQVNRLRAFLGIVTGLSLLTGGVAVYALQQKQEAQRHAQFALSQQNIADEQRIEALKQKNIAIAEKNRAEEQKKIAENARRDAEMRKEQANAAQIAEKEQRKFAEVARRQAETGEIEAKRQAGIAQKQTLLAEANANRAQAATVLAQEATQIAERQALNAQIQAEAIAIENFINSGLGFKALISGIAIGRQILRIDNLENSINHTKNRYAVSLGSILESPVRLQSASAFREALYRREWKERNTLLGHSGPNTWLSFNSDGQRIASASDDRTVKIWDLSGKLIQTLEGHTGDVFEVTFSPDDKLLASSSDDGTIRIWNDIGVEIATLQGHSSYVEGISFSPDGTMLASGSGDGTVRIWDLEANQSDMPLIFSEEGQLSSENILEDRGTYFSEHSLPVQKNQKLLIHVDSHDFDTYLMLVDSEGNIIAENDDRFGRNSGLGVTFNEAGTYRIIVTSYSAEERGAYRLSVKVGTPEMILKGHRASVQGVAFSPNGQYLASASTDGTVRLWDLQGHELQVLEGHAGTVWTVNFSPDGKTLGTTSGDKTARIWKLGEDYEEPLSLLNTQGNLTNEFSSEDQKSYFSEHTFQGIEGQEVLVRLESSDFDSFVKLFSEDDILIAENDDRFGLHSGLRIKLPVTGTYRVVVTSYEPQGQGQYNLSVKTGFSEMVLRGHADQVRALSFHPNMKIIATSSQDGTIRLWSFDGQELQTLKGHTSYVNYTSFSPDGRMLASASGDRTIKLWQKNDQSLLQLAGHTSLVGDVSFAPDGKTIATASSDNTVKLWSGSGHELNTLSGHTGIVTSVRFSPDSQTLATGSSDRTAKLWDASGHELNTLEGHTGTVWDVSFSPDGRIIATASSDNTVKLWDKSGHELRTLEGHRGTVWSVNFAPDGQTIASTSSDGTIKLWNKNGGYISTLEGHSGTVWDVSFSPDSQTFASTGEDGTVKLWDRSGRELQTFEGHTRVVRGVTFSPDGQTLASASDDGTVKLWSKDGRELQTLEGHTGAVLAVSFSPDGQILASSGGYELENGSYVGQVILWNFNLDDLMGKSCDWLGDYMANPATPPAEKALCDGYLAPTLLQSAAPGPLHLVSNVRAFLGTAFPRL